MRFLTEVQPRLVAGDQFCNAIRYRLLCVVRRQERWVVKALAGNALPSVSTTAPGFASTSFSVFIRQHHRAGGTQAKILKADVKPLPVHAPIEHGGLQPIGSESNPALLIAHVHRRLAPKRDETHDRAAAASRSRHPRLALFLLHDQRGATAEPSVTVAIILSVSWSASPDAVPSEWLADFEAAARRPLALRMRYAFIHTYKPRIDDAPFRAFASMDDYRRWCADLPSWLGYGRV